MERDWSHQDLAVTLARESIANGHRSIVVVMATGSGKSRSMAEIIRSAVALGKKVLFMVNRRGLVVQFNVTLSGNKGVEAGYIMSGYDYSPGKLVYTGTVQTVAPRIKSGTLSGSVLLDYKDALDPDIIIIDETQFGISKQYTDIYDEFPNAIKIGFTAAPCRADGRGLGVVFDDLIVVPGGDTASLTDKGILAPVRYFGPDADGIDQIKKIRLGKYTEKEQEEVFDKPKIVGDTVSEWLKNGDNRPTILFAVNVAHSRHLQSEFERHGISTVHLDAKSTDEERDAAFQDLNNGEVKILCNVGLFVCGTDVPDVWCVHLACKIASLGAFLQMIGRGIRMPEKTMYEYLIVIDQGGNVEEHGLVTDKVEWSLSDKEKAWKKPAKEKEKKPVICKSCTEIFESMSKCPRCGTELVSYGKDVEATDGELKEIGSRKANKKTDWPSKMLVMAGLKYYCAEKKYSDGWASHAYREIYGVWPNDPRVKNVVPIKAEKGTHAYGMRKNLVIRRGKRYAKKKKLEAAL